MSARSLLRRSKRTVLLGLCLCSLALAQPRGEGSAEPGLLLDRVVAIVRTRGVTAPPAESVITLSDLRFEAALVFLQRGTTAAAVDALDDEVLARALDYVISQRLHAQEADRLRTVSIQEQDVDTAEAELAALLGSPAQLDRFLARYDVSRAELRAVLERSLKAARSLDGRIRLRAQVGESEVRRTYAAEEARARAQGFELGSYEQVRATLREKLFRERYNALARDETQKLRDEADVRILVTFGEGA